MLTRATETFIKSFVDTGRPLAIILAGHNGSGKSTMWHKLLSPRYKMPLINADRMMMSVLPEINRQGRLPDWAQKLRDEDENWMNVSQRGVQSFIAQAMVSKVSFATETVFSHWKFHEGKIESKIDLIKQLQQQGYFVLLHFVGLASVELSMLRVMTRIEEGGHSVPAKKLQDRFPRTQLAIRHALDVADAAILVDNSASEKEAFKLCQFRFGQDILYDIRRDNDNLTPAIEAWLSIVAPSHTF